MHIAGPKIDNPKDFSFLGTTTISLEYNDHGFQRIRDGEYVN